MPRIQTPVLTTAQGYLSSPQNFPSHTMQKQSNCFYAQPPPCKSRVDRALLDTVLQSPALIQLHASLTFFLVFLFSRFLWHVLG